jgi:hypothetical protein
MAKRSRLEVGRRDALRLIATGVAALATAGMGGAWAAWP